MGTLWNKPVVQVVVRPTRHTFGFIESSPDFTLCAFPAEYRSALALLGSKSGRDGDKIKEAGLTPCASALTASPSYTQANLVIECRRIYADALKPECFLDPAIEENYPDKAYHHQYIGEVLAIRGDKTTF
jgi:flavin reductase (DIM6/NTAB) family NADH-FMN oxidoreductase RutF